MDALKDEHDNFLLNSLMHRQPGQVLLRAKQNSYSSVLYALSPIGYSNFGCHGMEQGTVSSILVETETSTCIIFSKAVGSK